MNIVNYKKTSNLLWCFQTIQTEGMLKQDTFHFLLKFKEWKDHNFIQSRKFHKVKATIKEMDHLTYIS